MVLIEESLVRWRQVPSPRGLHGCLWVLGHVVLTRGDPQRAAGCFAESLALGREAGDRRGIAQCLEGLAAVATATADSEPRTWSTNAARLLGAASALREALGIPVASVGQPTVERAVADARASLGEEEFLSAWARTAPGASGRGTSAC